MRRCLESNQVLLQTYLHKNYTILGFKKKENIFQPSLEVF